MITLNEHGSARIAGRRIKVSHVAIDSEHHGLKPTHIAEAYGLSLVQVHAALAYYHDHKNEIDEQIQASAQEADRLREAAGESPFVKRLRAEGRMV